MESTTFTNKSDRMVANVRKFSKVGRRGRCAQFFRNRRPFLTFFPFCIRHWIVLKAVILQATTDA